MELYNYQKRTAEFCKGKRSVILSVGVGLGKSVSTLVYLNSININSCLIVAPKLVAEKVWLQEMEKWGFTEMRERFTLVAGTKAQRAKAIRDSRFLIIGRDNLSDVAGMGFDVLVMDELSSFKNHESKRSEAIYSIQAAQRIGLTGSIITKGAIDLFGQFCAVGLGNFATKKERSNAFYRWRATHFKDKLAGSGLQFQNWQLVTPMEKLIERAKPNIFTLTTADWLEIPKVTHVEHHVELSECEMSEYLKLNTMLHCELDGEVVSFDEAQKFAKLQTLCNGFVYVDGEAVRSEHSTKIDEVVEFVDRCVGEGEQVLLFYAFKEKRAWIEEKLKRIHVKYCNVKDKNFMERWNSGDVDVLMGHPKSCSMGLNLHLGGARICVWSSLTYDYEDWAQANARLSRQGQKKAVQIHYFMAKNTVEPRKLVSLKHKSNELNEFLKLTK